MITEELKPSFQDFQLDMDRGPYRYYKVKPAKRLNRLFIGEIQFLTSSIYNYSNVTQPTSLPVYSSQTNIYSKDSLVRLVDRPLKELLDRPEYDGNPQTIPRVDSVITLNLKEPQYLTSVRLMPQHADNGINIGDYYELFYWDSNHWSSLGVKVAQANYLKFNGPRGRLYYLKNLSTGQEELPFTMSDHGVQEFIYKDFEY